MLYLAKAVQRDMRRLRYGWMHEPSKREAEIATCTLQLRTISRTLPPGVELQDLPCMALPRQHSVDPSYSQKSRPGPRACYRAVPTDRGTAVPASAPSLASVIR